MKPKFIGQKTTFAVTRVDIFSINLSSLNMTTEVILSTSGGWPLYTSLIVVFTDNSFLMLIMV